MRNAVILRGKGVRPCVHQCESLLPLLLGTQEFAHVQEFSMESLPTAIDLIPALIIFLQFSLRDWVKQVPQSWKRMWASARTFAVICDPKGQDDETALVALPETDDFIFCPYGENEFVLRIKRLCRNGEQMLRLAPERARGANTEFTSLVGESDTFLQALRKVGFLARSKAPVILSGETGSGKELFARAIHYQSPRKGKPFIPVNCGALPDELFENELFGHVRGAYTNASSAEKGLIAEAEGGTLFFDEVDTLSSATQVKLLRFLQSGEYRPLGSSRAVVADVRIIAATNADLSRRVESKRFREDLYYRLNVLSLSIPALRDRVSDVVPLAAHFLSMYAQEHDRRPPQLSDGALRKLLEYSWPGNVRELEGVVQRALVLHDSDVLTAEHLELPKLDERPASEGTRLRQAKALAIEQFERNYIANLLAIHGGNMTRAAEAAGKDRRSFQRLVSKYSLDRTSATLPTSR